MSSNGRWIRAERRLAIYLRDDFRCVYCGRDLIETEARGITLEHVVPRARGGTHHATNLVTCCLSCNSSRQDARLDRPTWLRLRRAARSIRDEQAVVRETIRSEGSLTRAWAELRRKRAARRRRAA